MILGIIPARGGSKGVKDKNIKLLDSKPLIGHTILAAMNSSCLDDFFVSTDSEKIKQVAESFGANVPFIRPGELANDEASTVNAVLHALKWYEGVKDEHVHTIVILQPTSPLRTSADIDNAIGQFESDSNNTSLISCYDATHVHPNIMYTIQQGNVVPFMSGNIKQRRQEFEPVYVRNGAIYICDRNYFVENHSLISSACSAYIMRREASINIDEAFDFTIADAILKSGFI